MNRLKIALLAAAVLWAPSLPAASAPSTAPVFQQPPAGTPNFTGKWIMPKAPKRLLTSAGAPPPLTADGKKEYAARQAKLKTDPKSDPITQCLIHGVPRIIYTPHPMLILQTTQSVVFVYEPNHTVRQAYFNFVEPDSAFPIWLGNSGAKWEGKTLVIDTGDFNALSWLDGTGLPHGEKLKTQERYTLVSPTQIKGEVKIEDPDFYAKPWTASFTLTKLPGMDLPERACAEDHEM